MHSFSGINLFSFYPQAKAFLKANKGNMTGAEEFWWYTKNYSQRSGWWNSLMMLTGPYLYFMLNVTKYNIVMKVLAGAGYALELACWVMFYLTRSDALKYAEYIIAAGREEGQHGGFI